MPAPRPPPSQSIPAPSASTSTPKLSIEAGFNSPPPPTVYTAKSSSGKALVAGQGAGGPRALVVGSFDHALPLTPWKQSVFPGVDWLSCYVSRPVRIAWLTYDEQLADVSVLLCRVKAIAVNEVNAAGGRVVTAPSQSHHLSSSSLRSRLRSPYSFSLLCIVFLANGAAGVIPSVLKYIVEFISDDPERDVKTVRPSPFLRDCIDYCLPLFFRADMLASSVSRSSC